MKSSPLIFLSDLAEKVNGYLESRDPKQKNLIVGGAFLLIILADVFILVRPVVNTLIKTTTDITLTRNKIGALEDDIKNKNNIMKKWEASRARLAQANSQFIQKAELPSLLEKLSALAQSANVRIITLKPQATSEESTGVIKVPIRMSAVAGTHALGAFLELLEGGPICYKVTDLRITANAVDEYRHTIELGIETYAKTS